MNRESTTCSERDRRLDEVVTAYLKAVEAGEHPEPKDWLERYPDLAQELSAFFAGQQQVAALAGIDTTGLPCGTSDSPLGTVRYIGDYELLEEIARGGMGVVYKARQVSLKRLVALKMILAGEYGTAPRGFGGYSPRNPKVYGPGRRKGVYIACRKLYLNMNCVITGASRGLGKAIAGQFAAQRYDLVLSSRDPAALSAAVRELGGQYPSIRIQSRPADLGDREQVRELGRWVLESGSVDVLVNNAGQFIYGSLYEEEEGVLERLMAVNLYSAYHLTRSLLPGMVARKSGHIFNICSIASLKAYHHGGAYGISKYALAGFSANLREEMKAFGIKVTAVYPGAAYTDSWAGSGVDPHRIMEAADIARMVVAAAGLSPQATVEEIVLRPQLGDL